MTLQVIAPIGVLALEKNENNNISTELKDGSKNVDFNYKFSLSETFDLIYNQETIEKYIIAYINTKIGTEYIVDVDESENTLLFQSRESILQGLPIPRQGNHSLAQVVADSKRHHRIEAHFHYF